MKSDNCLSRSITLWWTGPSFNYKSFSKKLLFVHTNKLLIKIPKRLKKRDDAWENKNYMTHVD